MKKTILVLTMIFATTLISNAKIVSKAVDYKDGDTQLQGWIYYDDGIKSPKPAVIVVHEWWGLNDYPKMRAQQLAELGYIAFAADIYGKGVVKTSFDEAGAEAGKYRSNIPLLRSRINSALETLKKQPNVDKNKIAAIGYCFGGGTVLELARKCAEDIGLDIERFKKDFQSDTAKHAVIQDIETARHYGINGVPSIVIDGTKIQSGALSYPQLLRVLGLN